MFARTDLPRRHFLRTSLWAPLLPAALGLSTAAQAAAGSQTHTVTDLAGRRVTLPLQIDRILLGEGRLLPALAILEAGDPTPRLAGMMGEFELLDPAGYAQWLARFPRLGTLPRFGGSNSSSFSDEKALALRPQLAIFSLGGGHTPGEHDNEVLGRLTAAGVPVIFVDFRQDPLRNTPLSMVLLGEVMGRQARAREFIQFWTKELQRVIQPLARLQPAQKPRVFLESRVGLSPDCCDTMTGMLGHLLEAAGGRNVGSGLLPGESGLLNPELLLAQQPDVYIGTGIGSMQSRVSAPQRIALGAGVTPQAARQSLAHALQRRPFSLLTAVKTGRAHAIWHHFYTSPLNVVAVQVMARWLHPQRLAALDPMRTWQEINQRFVPVPLDGTYWTSLVPAQA